MSSQPNLVTAFLCPGQGAQSPAMLPLIATSPLLPLASELVGEDLSAAASRDEAFFKRNEISAVLVALASITAHDKLKIKPEYYAGYSVGQWTAMHLAGMLDAPTLLQTLVTRAELMNETRAVKEGAMLAVIGLPREKVDEVILSSPEYLIVANDNAPGQFTLSGTYTAIAVAEAKLTDMKPQKLLRVPVAGAWHCELVRDAVGPFHEYLATIPLSMPKTPVISNVTAQPLGVNLQEELAAHLASPVRWAESIRYMITHGVERFIEIGHETTLTKFGFFIDRSKQHLPWVKAA
jgi:[acyl-carrier-protein] S-malonyltransferase